MGLKIEGEDDGRRTIKNEDEDDGRGR